MLPAVSPDFTGMKTIAIIGASGDRQKFGNKAVRAFRQQGYQVYPVNPKAAAIEGLPAFKSIAEVPVRPQLISVYLPPAVLLKVLPDNAVFGNTTAVSVQISASDSDGSVTNVQLFNGTVLLRNFTAGPYNFSGTVLAGSFALGTNTLTAVA